MPFSADKPAVTLDGASLALRDLTRVAGGNCRVRVAEESLAGLDAVRGDLIRARSGRQVYGANTGVGANRNLVIDGEGGRRTGDSGGGTGHAEHARRLLLSHCVGVGPVEDDAVTRGAMCVRLNQFLAGGSGISSRVARGLLAALDSGALPTLHRLGCIGMGDLAPLAELALTLSGDREWRSGGIDSVDFADSDALPFMSSSAVTLATAALGAEGLQSLLRSAVVVAALSHLALEGSPEAYSDVVHRGRAHLQQREVAAEIRRLTGVEAGRLRPGARLQDPFGLRAFPQVHSPAMAALQGLVDALEAEINAAAENPLIVEGGVLHHGQFHLAGLAASLDHARTAAYPVLTLCAARLGMLFRPDLTRLPAFLAHGPAGSSGLMITEYVVQDALAEARTAVVPVSGASVSVSLGLEDHASFATQGARQLRELARLASVVIACEAVAATRALRMASGRLGNGPARGAFEYLAAGLDPDLADHPPGGDIAQAVGLLPGLAGFLSGGGF